MYSLAYLRLNGVKAREHPVFIELTRVKQYFDKIKVAETPVAERNMTVDKAAAARFIKAGLVRQISYTSIVRPHHCATTNMLFSPATINMILREQSNKQRSEQKRISDLSKHRRRPRPNERQRKQKK